MNHELQLELVRQARASADPTEFWAYAASAVAGFAQEHIGTARAHMILQATADGVAEDWRAEAAH